MLFYCDWKDIVVLIGVIIGSLLSLNEYPGADSSKSVRFLSSISTTVFVSLVTAFQDYFDNLQASVVWLQKAASFDMPVIAYIVILTLGVMSLSFNVLTVVLGQIQNVKHIKIVSLLASVVYIFILFHALTLEVSVSKTITFYGVMR